MTKPARKASGIAWLGEIPSHWSLNYLGNVVEVAGGSTPSKENLDFWGGTIPWVSPKDMKRDVIFDSEDHVTELALKRSNLRLIPSPAVLMVIRGMILDHTVPIGLTARPVTVNQDMKALRPRTGVLAEYLTHFLRAMNEALLARVEEAGHGTKALRTDLWRKLPVLLPPEAEQRAIVAFLDSKTAAIDAFIGKKERLIELLQEKRQALITQAVTRGLNSSVPMKESGIEWLGRIPATWSAVPLRRLLRGVEQGWSPESEDRPADEGEWAVLKLSAISKGRFRPQEQKALPLGVKPEKRYEVRAGDLLLTRANTPLLVGDVCCVEATPPRLMLPDLIYRLTVRQDLVMPAYLAQFLLSAPGRAQVMADARGSSMSMAKVSGGHIRAWVVPLVDERAEPRGTERAGGEA